MTREEAIEVLDKMKYPQKVNKNGFIISNVNIENEALDMAINALSPAPCDDLISREETLTAFADYVGGGMSMNDYDALWDIVTKMPTVKQEPKFMAKSDGTIEHIKNCDDCLFKKEWKKIGKLISVVLKKQTEQEPCDDAISRQAAIETMAKLEQEDIEEYGCSIPECFDGERAIETLKQLPPVRPKEQTGHWIKYGKLYQCSECKELSCCQGKFCNECGTRMVEPQESKEGGKQ